MARPSAEGVRAAAVSGGGAKTAAQLGDAGLLAFLGNIAPIAGVLEADMATVKAFTPQAEHVQPAPPAVRDALEQITSILAGAADSAKEAALAARNRHREDWARAEQPRKNQYRGDVRYTMRDGEA